MLTEYESRPALGHNKQSYCFRMVCSLLPLLSAIVDTKDEVAALAAADDDVDDDDDGSCKLYRIHLLAIHIYVLLLMFTRLSSSHHSLLKPVVLIMRKQNQFFGLLNFTASLFDI